jgi:uncharacterized protein with HEPN domain
VKQFEDYRSSAVLCAAAERKFEIIGEALAQLIRLDESKYPGVPFGAVALLRVACRDTALNERACQTAPLKAER